MQPRRQSSRIEKLKHQKEVEKKFQEQKNQGEISSKEDKEMSEKERIER